MPVHVARTTQHTAHAGCCCCLLDNVGSGPDSASVSVSSVASRLCPVCCLICFLLWLWLRAMFFVFCFVFCACACDEYKMYLHIQ